MAQNADEVISFFIYDAFKFTIPVQQIDNSATHHKYSVFLTRLYTYYLSSPEKINYSWTYIGNNLRDAVLLLSTNCVYFLSLTVFTEQVVWKTKKNVQQWYPEHFY